KTAAGWPIRSSCARSRARAPRSARALPRTPRAGAGRPARSLIPSGADYLPDRGDATDAVPERMAAGLGLVKEVWGAPVAVLTCAGGFSCYGERAWLVLAVLEGELGPLALSFGRSFPWNALPRRFQFDVFGELYRVSHPLRRPAAFLRNYERL